MAGAMAGPHPKKPRRAAGPPAPAPPPEADEALGASTGPEDGAGEDEAFEVSTGPEDGAGGGAGGDDSGSAASSSGSEDEEEEEGEGDEDEDDEEGGEVDVTFDFFDPTEIDYKGLRALLVTYLDGQAFRVEELVSTIIRQSTVGTVVKNAEDLDPIGVLTVLSLRRYAALQCLQEIKAFLVGQCRDADLRSKLAEAWEAPGTGLLLSERLLNCPPQLAPPLVQALFEEVAWAQEDEPTQDLRDSFKFERFLAVSRVYTDPATSVASHAEETTVGNGQKKKRKQKKAGGKQQPLIVYARPEDEFLHKHSTWSFTFSVAGDAARRDELARLRLVMEELDAVVGNVAQAANPQLAR